MSPNNLRIIFSKNPEVFTKETDEKLVLYDAGMEAVHILNRTAYLIWELCDGQHTISDIEEIMRDRFSIDHEYDLMNDIDQAVQQLLVKGLLVERNSQE